MRRASASAGARLQVELVPDAARRRQAREALAEALHAPALLVHRDDQRRGACGVDVRHQRTQLRGVLVVAA